MKLIINFLKHLFGIRKPKPTRGMTAKEFLFNKGITDSPEKSLFVKRPDGSEFDMAALMEEFRAIPGKTQKVRRSAVDGRFVSAEEAKQSPETTVTETVKK